MRENETCKHRLKGGTEERMRTKGCLLVCALCACVLPSQGAGDCLDLPLLKYGLLLFNGSDVSESQPEYHQNDTVQYQCARGYVLWSESGASVSTSTTTCQRNGQWSLVNVTCRVFKCNSPPAVENAVATSNATEFGSLVPYNCMPGYSLDRDGAAVCTMHTLQWINVPQCQVVPVLTTMEIVIIVAAVLGGISLILFFLLLVLCCRICMLHSKLNEGNWAEDEIALARSQGVFALSNPLVGGKPDAEEAAGNPLYLTPDELNEFEHKNV